MCIRRGSLVDESPQGLVRRESLQIGQPFEYAAHERELHAINTTAKECRNNVSIRQEDEKRRKMYAYVV